MQLVEQSLDTNLLNNAIKLKFSHCPVLPGGIHIQETLNNVIILICTNQSVHRLLLAHPTRMYRSVSRQYRDTKGYVIYYIYKTWKYVSATFLVIAAELLVSSCSM